MFRSNISRFYNYINTVEEINYKRSSVNSNLLLFFYLIIIFLYKNN